METRQEGPESAGSWIKENQRDIVRIIACLAEDIHKLNHRWWHTPDGQRLQRNKGEMLALIHSEISEALEGARKGKADEHLPQYSSEVVELADAMIRILDYAAGHGHFNLATALLDKLEYNARRADHKWENRALPGGKKF